MAAELVSAAGLDATLYERMASPGRKLLMAGRGGLNLTHSEPVEKFLARYGAASDWLAPILKDFSAETLIAWASGLGQETFTGSSGRVFPRAMKASPLLRAWLARLAAQNVQLRTGHDWQGWDEEGALIFRHDGTQTRASTDATILALGGASWPRLGANGAWAEILKQRGVSIAPLRPANCGFVIPWSATFARFAGTPLKNILLRFADAEARGEAIITSYGIEGGAVYALGAAIRDAIESQGEAIIEIDLRPDLALEQLTAKLTRGGKGQSLANHLRKSLRLSSVAINLLRESHGVRLPDDPARLAACIKSSSLRLTAVQPLARAISTAGGVSLAALDSNLMLMPGIFAAGEMLDWEAPTGGYLLQASLATGVAAAKGALRYLETQSLARST
jgi:hypothetical protein